VKDGFSFLHGLTDQRVADVSVTRRSLSRFNPAFVIKEKPRRRKEAAIPRQETFPSLCLSPSLPLSLSLSLLPAIQLTGDASQKDTRIDMIIYNILDRFCFVSIALGVGAGTIKTANLSISDCKTPRPSDAPRVYRRAESARRRFEQTMDTRWTPTCSNSEIIPTYRRVCIGQTDGRSGGRAGGRAGGRTGGRTS